ncbi:uncharacterized protein LOC124338243 [Daphnia pulicaria]|uniref:uncharacterized protein LOC124338243 n=1 Tax=Daphnia pulicaria TaxID=35523 RepID=UPI001EEB227D|nr:uncharacterized protein LOC124338243 [Daphnia pulicaria]
MTLKVEIFKIYHVVLRKENVIDKNKFHRHFIEQNNLSQNISEFRDIFFKLWSKDNKNAGHSQFANFLKTSTFNCSKNFGISNEVSNKTLDDKVADEEITEFLDKLVFAVNMPNEVRLGNILTKEVGQHFNVRGCDFQSSFILEKLLDWFKKKKSNPILKEAKDKTTTGGRNLFEETRQKMVALRATAFSIDFRANYLPLFFRESFQYHEETITQKAEELEVFLNSPEENKTLQISTKSLRCTTVKILSALDTLPRFKDSDDGYLLIESEHLMERNKHMKEWVQGAMNEDKSHQVLVVIGEIPVQVGSYEKELMPKDTQLRKKMIFICSDGLATQFEELFDSMENSDVIFKIGDRPFPAHKLILVTRCQVFAAMFKHETKEKLSNEIEIKNVEPDVFHQLLRFIYTGRLSLATMETMAVALFIAADKYLLDQLTNKCELFLLYKMTPVNCLELLLHADLLNFAKLKEDAAVYFRRHQERVMATDTWKIVEQECPSLLGDIQECILAKIS